MDPKKLQARIRQLEAENKGLAKQLKAARREIAELKATNTVDIDIDDLEEEPSGFEQEKTVQLSTPPPGALTTGSVDATLDSALDSTLDTAPHEAQSAKEAFLVGGDTEVASINDMPPELLAAMEEARRVSREQAAAENRSTDVQSPPSQDEINAAVLDGEQEVDPFDGLEQIGRTNPHFKPLEAVPIDKKARKKIEQAVADQKEKKEKEEKSLPRRTKILAAAALAIVLVAVAGLMVMRSGTQIGTGVGEAVAAAVDEANPAFVDPAQAAAPGEYADQPSADPAIEAALTPEQGETGAAESPAAETEPEAEPEPEPEPEADAAAAEPKAKPKPKPKPKPKKKPKRKPPKKGKKIDALFDKFGKK